MVELVRWPLDDSARHVHGEFLRGQSRGETAGDGPATLGRTFQAHAQYRRALAHPQPANKAALVELRVDAHLEHVIAHMHLDASRLLTGSRVLDKEAATEFVAHAPQAAAVTIAHQIIGGTGEQLLA